MKEQFLNFRGLEEFTNYIKTYIDSKGQIHPYASYTLFPSVGEPEAIYIDTTTNAIYRWDDNNIKYYHLAFDPNAEYTMQCGGAKG